MITSYTNSRIRDLRRVLRKPAEWSVFAVEGVRAVEEAVRAGVKVEKLFYSGKLEAAPRGVTLLDSLAGRGTETIHVSESVLDRVAATETGQGVIAVIAKLNWRLEDLTAAGRPILVPAGLRDPGNAGTLIRVADAFDLGGLAFTPDSVDPYHQKVLRSAVGSCFRVPVCRRPFLEILSILEEEGYHIVRAEAAEGTPLRDVQPRDRLAVILGNEGHGVDAQVKERVSEALQIPMPGRAESLNVAVTGAIIAYECNR